MHDHSGYGRSLAVKREVDIPGRCYSAYCAISVNDPEHLALNVFEYDSLFGLAVASRFTFPGQNALPVTTAV